MYIDSQPALSPEVLAVLKQDIMSSLHVAMPGIVKSYDSTKKTVDVQPALRSQLNADGAIIPYPLLRDVPVFMPAALEVNPGDGCLVIFADCDIDRWVETGEAEVPASARMHSLSDGFAFVGFRKGGNSG